MSVEVEAEVRREVQEFGHWVTVGYGYGYGYLPSALGTGHDQKLPKHLVSTPRAIGTNNLAQLKVSPSCALLCFALYFEFVQ
ncbi:hypothetical protein CVT26_007134 [Gymnopilus dilepis]|uniref:Uncharacterized protein n=1 Tax=Gymnopilus dilepis TaxID=231916 RepID=A0A409W1G5_9AGAR|nr:hypothetical protein CVT26_007134 [Gymnopilus dilepis]